MITRGNNKSSNDQYDYYYDERYAINRDKTELIRNTPICGPALFDYLAHLQTQIDILKYRLGNIPNA